MTPASPKSKGPGARQIPLLGWFSLDELDEEPLGRMVEEIFEAYVPELKAPGFRISRRMQTTLGSYSHRKREIALSDRLIQLGDRKSVWRVLLHEVAHAITMQRYRDPAPHGRQFREVCAEIRADPKATMDIEGLESEAPVGISFRCTSCGRRILSKRKTGIIRCQCGAQYRVGRSHSEPVRYSYQCTSCGRRILRRRKTAIVRCSCGARYRTL